MNIQQHPDVSVVIPSYNSSRVIEQCLTSVCNQTTTATYQVIVVDSSDDETARIIAEKFPNITLVCLHRKTIPAVARNMGVDETKAQIIAFTDADCIVDPDWLKSCLETHAGGYDVVGGSIENARPKNLISIAEYFLEFREFSSRTRPREVQLVPAGNMSIRRAIFEHIGKFPTIRASEDVLFSYNLINNGVRMFFNPNMRVFHLNRNRLMPFIKNQWMLGVHFSMGRRLAPVRGHQLVRFAPLLLLLPIVRFLTTLQFILKNRFPHNLQQLVVFSLSLPFFLPGLIAWAAGAIKGRWASIPK